MQAWGSNGCSGRGVGAAPNEVGLQSHHHSHSTTRSPSFSLAGSSNHHCRPRKADKRMVGCQRPIQSSPMSASSSNFLKLMGFDNLMRGAVGGKQSTEVVLSCPFIFPLIHKVCNELSKSVPPRGRGDQILPCNFPFLNLLTFCADLALG